MKLSVILPVYNVEKYIERCIVSLEKQNIDKGEYELIVVDDGSRDGSVGLVEKLCKSYPNIYIFHKTNGGLSSARNFGLKFAKGDYIWFVDSDDFVEENVIGHLLDRAYNERLDLLLFNIYDVWTDRECPGFVIDQQPDRVISGKEYIEGYDIGKSAWCFIVRRDIINDNDIFFTEGIIHEDYEFTLRLYEHVGRLAFDSRRVYNYLHREGSITTIRSEAQTLKSIHSWQTIIGNENKYFSGSGSYSKAARVLADDHKFKGLCVLFFSVLPAAVKVKEYRRFKDLGAFDMPDIRISDKKMKFLNMVVGCKPLFYLLIHFYRTGRQ